MAKLTEVVVKMYTENGCCGGCGFADKSGVEPVCSLFRSPIKTVEAKGQGGGLELSLIRPEACLAAEREVSDSKTLSTDRMNVLRETSQENHRLRQAVAKLKTEVNQHRRKLGIPHETPKQDLPN